MIIQDHDLFLKNFFREINAHLLKTQPEAQEVWFELSEIETLKGFDEVGLIDFLSYFDSIDFIEEKYSKFLVVDKIRFILDEIKILDVDVSTASNIIDCYGFESLIEAILIENNFKTIKNFRFSCSRVKEQGIEHKYRFEIDVLGYSNNKLLVIDAKKWKKRDPFSALNKAANKQYIRALSLSKDEIALSDVLKNLKSPDLKVKKKSMLKIIPLLVTLENCHFKINENDIPIVSIFQFNNFLHELDKNIYFFNVINI